MGSIEAEEFNQSDVPEEIKQELANRVDLVLCDSSCFRPAYIQPTPGWVNDDGHHYRSDDDTRGIPAYMSVGIYLLEPLSAEALRVVVSRAKEYLSRTNEYTQGATATLEGVRLVTEYSESISQTLDVEV